MSKKIFLANIFLLVVAIAVLAADVLVLAQNQGGMAAKPSRRGGCDPAQQEQADLSGTYTGNVDYPDGGLTGDATLTITGSTFTLTGASATQTGRITAVTTCGYTAATMMFGEVATPKPGEPAPAPPPTVSLHAKKSGKRLTLASVAGEKRSFTFGTGSRPRRSRAKAAVPAAPTEPATPATPATPAAPAEPAMPANPETPPEAGPVPTESAKPVTPARKTRRSRSKKPTSNANSNTP